MPSHMMEPQGLSPSSYVSEDLSFRDAQRQSELWKANSLRNYHGVPSSLLDTRRSLGSPVSKYLQHPDSYPNQDRQVKIEKPAAALDRVATLSLPRALDHKLDVRSVFIPDSTSYSVEGERINKMSSQYENGLFSSSLSELFSRKLRFSMNGSPHGHSVGEATLNYKEEEPFESLEELEAQTIGNLLPDDDDLLSGVNDCVGQHNAGDAMEDLDLFSSVGGMDLGEDVSLGHHSASIGGEHPFGEHSSRTLFVRNIDSSIEDLELQTLFEKYGEIRTLYTACKHRGFVMISYCDIRAAWSARKALQNKPVRQRNLDIHMFIPKDNPSEKDVNEGTLVVSSLDSSVSNDELRQIFGVYGEIKEIRETPHGSHQKFLEFYDIRAAEAALHASNRSDFGGKQIKVEASYPGGTRWSMQSFCSELERDESALYLQQHRRSNLTTVFAGAHPRGGNALSTDNGSILGTQSANSAATSSYFDNAFDRGISPSIPNSLPSLVSLEAKGNRSCVGESGISPGHIKFQFSGMQSLLPHNRDFSNSPGGMSSTINIGPSEENENRKYFGSDGHSVELNKVFGPSGYGSCPTPGHHYMWSNLHQPQPQGMMWPNSPSFVSTQQLHAVPRTPCHTLNTLLPITNHHMGSAPSINPILWDRRRPYAGESPDASVFHPGSLGSEFVSRNMFARGGSSMDLPLSSKNIGLHSRHQGRLVFAGRDQIIPMMNSFDSPNERTRSRRNEGSSSQTENRKQFELDLERIARGDDKRTTLMIKNIPNKYTSKMLLAAIDERHRGTYDFIYLPIDFKNKCNVGYAFINMTDPSLIIPFYQVFNGKRWEKFNSEKVASLAYARIQGKAALIAHFQNSSLMNEDKRCRPILFHTDGPNAGDQVPFPMGVNIRMRSSRSRVGTYEENNQEGQPISTTGEDSLNGESSSGCVSN